MPFQRVFSTDVILFLELRIVRYFLQPVLDALVTVDVIRPDEITVLFENDTEPSITRQVRIAAFKRPSSHTCSQ